MTTWIKVVIIVAAVALLALAWNAFLDCQRDIGYQKAVAEYTATENVALKAALEETGRLNKIIQEANDAATKREEANRVLVARNAVLLGRLRDTDSIIAERVSTASAEALRHATAAFQGLFADCRGKFAGMGQAAAGHLSDVTKLSDGWPKAKEEALKAPPVGP